MYSTDHKQLDVHSRLTCEGGASACEQSMQHSRVAYKYSRVVYKCARASVSRRARRFCEHTRVNVVCDLYCKSGTSCCYANILLLAAFSGSSPWIGSNRSKISSYRTYCPMYKTRTLYMYIGSLCSILTLWHKYNTVQREIFAGFNFHGWSIFTISWVYYSQTHAFTLITYCTFELSLHI